MRFIFILSILFLFGCEVGTPDNSNPTTPTPTEDVAVGMTVSNTIDHFPDLYASMMRYFNDRGKRFPKDTYPFQSDTIIGQGAISKIDYDQPKITWGMEDRVRRMASQTDFLIYCEEHIFLHELEPDRFADYFRKQYHLKDWGTLEKLEEYCKTMWPALDGYIEAYQPYNEFWLTNAETDEEGRKNYQDMLRTIVESFEAYDWKKKPILVTPPLPYTTAGTMWDDGKQGDFIPVDLRPYFKAIAYHAYAVRGSVIGDLPEGQQVIWERSTDLPKDIIDKAYAWMTEFMPGTPLWATEIGYPNRLNIGSAKEPIWEDTEEYAAEHIEEVIEYGITKNTERFLIFEAFEESTNYLYADTYILSMGKDGDTPFINRLMKQGVLLDSINVE